MGSSTLTRFYKYLTNVEPKTEAQKALHGEALRQFSNMVGIPAPALASVSTQLPPIVWMVVIGGSCPESGSDVAVRGGEQAAA